MNHLITFDGKGELLITIMSSLAQEESRSISENVTWGHRKRMADGKVYVAYSTFLGYDKGPDGNLVVNQEQAKIVRLIYRSFMEGMSYVAICRMLEERGIPTPAGNLPSLDLVVATGSNRSNSPESRTAGGDFEPPSV